MRRIILILLAQFALLANVGAQSIDGVKVDGLRIKRNDGFLAVRMDIDLSSLEVSSNSAVLITPMLVNGNDSLELSSLGFYGRRRYYHYVRNDQSIISAGGKSFRESEKPQEMGYDVVVPYEKWMDGACLVLHRSDFGCCNKVVGEQFSQLALFKESVFSPKYRYVRPVRELEKVRSLSGTAYIDFAVNRIAINPGYRRNLVELAKITGTIDSIKNDTDIIVTALEIKGYASPEGSYESNARLAEGRTASLEAYVQNLYNFAPDFIATSYEPEDWAGLRAYVATSALVNKDAILALIDGNREPDNKEWMIMSTYADDYNTIYKECYPALRRSDYRIEYTIRSYTDVDEIKRVFAETPQKLSLEEFYILAQQYDAGSRELNDVFETAVRMYPNDQVANLNAAISEMQNGDYSSALPHLRKAGDSAEALYARGLYAAFTKEYDNALQLLQKALEMGIDEAADAIHQINEIR